MWYVLNKSKLGMLIRAGVDDEILAASGVRIQLIFVCICLWAGLAGIAGVVGGTFQSIAPEKTCASYSLR